VSNSEAVKWGQRRLAKDAAGAKEVSSQGELGVGRIVRPALVAKDDQVVDLSVVGVHEYGAAPRAGIINRVQAGD
jgi:hypothetical protein